MSRLVDARAPCAVPGGFFIVGRRVIEQLVVEMGSGPHEGVATVLVENPGKPVVVLNAELIERLALTLESLPEDLEGLVLASASERVFVAGADLAAIQAMDDAALDVYLRRGAEVFMMLASKPYTTVAAINGAALGGGLELAMHCDAIVAAPSASGKAYPVGLPEAGLSICPGWGGTNLMPARMEAGEAIARTASGTPMVFDEACEFGLFDDVCVTADELREYAMDHALRTSTPKRDGAPAAWIGRDADEVRAALDAAALGDDGPAQAVRAAMLAGLDEGWGAALDVERRELIRLRNEPAGKAAIEAFFAKSAKPK